MYYKLMNKNRDLEYGYIFDLDFKKMKLPEFSFDFEKFCFDVCKIVIEDLKEAGNTKVHLLNEMKDKEIYLENDFKICVLRFCFASLGNIVCFDVFFYKLAELYEKKISKELIELSTNMTEIKKLRINKKNVDLKAYEVYMEDHYIVYKK